VPSQRCLPRLVMSGSPTYDFLLGRYDLPLGADLGHARRLATQPQKLNCCCPKWRVRGSAAFPGADEQLLHLRRLDCGDRQRVERGSFWTEALERNP
jgi:hypothetical protein